MFCLLPSPSSDSKLILSFELWGKKVMRSSKYSEITCIHMNCDLPLKRLRSLLPEGRTDVLWVRVKIKEAWRWKTSEGRM